MVELVECMAYGFSLVFTVLGGYPGAVAAVEVVGAIAREDMYVVVPYVLAAGGFVVLAG